MLILFRLMDIDASDRWLWTVDIRDVTYSNPIVESDCLTVLPKFFIK